MRKMLISILLAGAAASPAIAGPHNWSDRQQVQDDRQQAKDDRQQARQDRQAAREERAQSREDSRGDRGSFAPRQPVPQQLQQPQQQPPSFNRYQFRGYDGAQREAEMNAARDARRNSYDAARTQRFQGQQMFDQRQQDARDARQYRQSERYAPNVRPGRPLIVSNVPRPGTQPPLRGEGRRSPDVQWNTNWRHDDRYDWHDYRNHHRSLFHFGFYYDPYGWGYQPFSIGWRLWPGYYDSQFWINDPWMYRLPYAPPGYVWVRYWNDALLVDTWSGTVVDMIPGFFW